MSKIDSMLYLDEGFRNKPYYDSEGYPTIGIGQLLGPKGTPLSAYSFTMPEHVAREWVSCHADELSAILAASEPLKGVWPSLNDARRDALINMAYQLGAAGTTKGIWGFRKMLAAVAAQDWLQAFKEGQDSKWYMQTPARARRVLTTLQMGDYRAYESLKGWV